MTAPIASGWSGCRVGFAPTGKRRLCTAHTHLGHRADSPINASSADHCLRIPSSTIWTMCDKSCCARPLKDAVLKNEPHRLAHPHWHAEFFALRDCKIDVLHEYLDGCTKVESAWQHGLGKDVHRCEIAAGSIVEDVQHGVGRNAGLARHRHCLRRGDEGDGTEQVIGELHRLRSE